MPQIIKTIPLELKPDSTYALRIRSVNSFGAVSDWSETTIIDTSPAGLAGAGRLVIGDSSITAYDNNGQISFNYSSQASIRTNLVTNPSFESVAVGTTGWVAEPSTTMSRITTDYFVGQPGLLACLKVIASADATGVGVSTTTADAVRRVAVTAGTAYTGTAYARVPTGQSDTDIRISFRFYSSGGVLISETSATRPSILKSTNNWVRLSTVGQVAPAGSAFMSIIIKAYSAMTTGHFWYLDGVMVEATAILKDYFDGSTSAGTSSWVGTINDSKSTLDNNSIYTVNGGVFTSPVLQTSRSVATTGGVIIDPNGLRAYDTTGNNTVNISSTLAKITVGNTQIGNNIRGSLFTGIAVYDQNWDNAWIRRNDGSVYLKAGSTTKYLLLDTAGTSGLVFPNFTLDDNGIMRSTSGKITAGQVQLGVDVGPTTGHDGLVLTSTDFNNIFLRRQSDGVVFFRINAGGTNNITYDSATGVLNINGNISGGSIDIGGFDSTSFHVDSSGNAWLGSGSFATAPFRLGSTGYLQVVGADAYIQMSVQSNGFAVYGQIDFFRQTGANIGGVINSNNWLNLTASSTMDFNASGAMTLVSSVNTKIVSGSASVKVVAADNATYINAAVTQANSLTVGSHINSIAQLECWTNAGSNYFDSTIYVDPGFHSGSRAQIGFHPGGVAGSIMMLANSNAFNFIDNPGTGYIPIFGGAYTNASSRRFKQDIEQWPPLPPKSLSAAARTVTASERLRDIEVVSFRLKKEQALAETMSSQRRERALARLNAYKEKMSRPLYPRPIHECALTTCGATIDDPCARIKNWDQKEIGIIIEQVESILPEIVSYDHTKDPIGLNNGSAIGFLLAVVKELEDRLSTLEAGNGSILETPDPIGSPVQSGIDPGDQSVPVEDIEQSIPSTVQDVIIFE